MITNDFNITSTTTYTAKDFLKYSYPEFNADIRLMIFVSEKSDLLGIKERLLKIYNNEHIVFAKSAEGTEKTFNLDNLESLEVLSLTQLTLNPADKKTFYSFNDLLEIMYRLRRKEDGCPWDIAQTHESIKLNAIEEAYELVDAINNFNYKDICEEAGDVLLQTVFHAKIAEDDEKFNIFDILSVLCEKILSRHTHVFGKDKALNSEDALNLWNKNKMTEKKQENFTQTLLAVPKAFPAILRAEKVQKRAAKSGFDFENIQQIFDKLDEEIAEVKLAIDSKNIDEIKGEIGDLLFSAVNLVRFLKIDGEESLNLSTEKFINRFKRMEEYAEQNNIKLETLSAKQFDEIYNISKNKL